MKNKIKIIGLLFILAFLGLNAQTPYFYYYRGEKQYLELDTRHIFVSVADGNAAKELTFENAKKMPFHADLPEGWQSKINHKRFWTTLSFEEIISDEAYLAKLSEIQNFREDIIVAPYFKGRNQEKFGISNFFNVMLKSLNDTILLQQVAEREQATSEYQAI